MSEAYTEGALRALDRAHARAHRRGVVAVEPLDLLLALVDEEESRATALLAEFGFDAARLREALGLGMADDEPTPTPAGALVAPIRLPPSPAFRTALNDASTRARALGRGRPIGTEHLLTGVLATSAAGADLLAVAGLDMTALVDRLTAPAVAEAAPLPL